MVAIKITDVIQCSSEDSTYPSANLVRNQGYWVCSKDNKESSIEVELQFEKEAVISFIDIGNHGSQMVDILVSHSTRCRGAFVCLVPTFNFMSVVESKQGLNTQGVQMFKADDMISESKFLAWDRLKLVCRQPYANGKQFGLSFISLKTVPRVEKDVSKKLEDKNQNKLNDFFDKLHYESTPLRKPKITMWSSPLSPKVGQLKSPKLKENRTPISPTDLNTSGEKTPKRILSAAAIAQFREEVSCFLEDVNFNDLMKTRTIKVSDLRNQIEKQRGLALVRQQKILFMEIITERLKVMKQSIQITGNLVASPANQPIEAKNIDYDVECKKCHTKLPKSVIAIHSKLCMPSTPTRSPTPSHTPRNRNQLCFDVGDDIGDVESPRKRTKLNTSESSSSGIDNSNKLNGISGSNGNSPTNTMVSGNVSNKVPVVNGIGPPSFSSKDSVKNKLCSILTKKYPDSSVSDKAMIIDSYENDSNMVGPSSGVDIQLATLRDSHIDLTTKKDKACDVKKGLVSVDLSEFDDNRNDIMGEADSAIGECPICFLQIPMFKLEIHASNCEGKMEEDGGHVAADDANLPSLSLDDVVDVVQQLESAKEVSTNTKDLVQCPICQKMFSAERIDVHANVCLDFSSDNLEMSD